MITYKTDAVKHLFFIFDKKLMRMADCEKSII